MAEEKSIGNKVDEVVEKVKAKVAEVKGKASEVKDKVVAAQGDAGIVAREVAKGVKRAVEDTSDAVKDLINKKP